MSIILNHLKLEIMGKEQDNYALIKTVNQLQEFLEEFESFMEEKPDKKDLAITHQAYLEEFLFLTKDDDILKGKTGKFLIKGPQPAKRLVDTKVADLFRKHASAAQSEGCTRLSSLFELHAIGYELGFGSTFSYGIVEQMRQHFLPGDTAVSEN